MLVPAYHSEGKHSKDKPDTEDGGPGQAPRSGPGRLLLLRFYCSAF